jgi:hypothetical protein
MSKTRWFKVVEGKEVDCARPTIIPNHGRRKKKPNHRKQKELEAKLLVKSQKRKLAAIKCYTERNENLKQLGFNSYDEYLKSPLWQEIRNKVLERDKQICCVCSKVGNQVHHLSYNIEVLNGQDMDKLKCICGRCHKQIEFKGKIKKKRRTKQNYNLPKEKLSVNAANNKMLELKKQYNKNLPKNMTESREKLIEILFVPDEQTIYDKEEEIYKQHLRDIGLE